MSTITTKLVTKDGLVDQDASKQEFETQLIKYCTEMETESTVVAAAVEAVFDKFRGAAINMPALGNFALQHLNALPGNYKALQDKALQYVRDNSNGKGQNLFSTAKGPKGGVKRISDQPVPAAPAADPTPAA